MALLVFLFFVAGINGLKIWVPNTDVNNKLNWDLGETPRECDKIYFEGENDVVSYWNLKDVTIAGLSLPRTGDVVISNHVKIQFKDEVKCPRVRDIKYIRNKVKGWLDPDNWKSDSRSEWLPHSERVPCAGERILFLPERTFAIQLPSILVPIGEINFDTDVFNGELWSEFLRTDLGSSLFRGPDDLRSLPWRNDGGCSDKKKCICGRSPYTIRSGEYKEVDLRTFEEAVCLYAMPKCKPSDCYSPVKPDGHCCGICGAVIKIEDTTEEGLNLDNIRAVVNEEMMEHSYSDLGFYVGRTKDGNVQIVIVAKDSGATLKSHMIASLLKRKLIGQKSLSRFSSRVSGLTLSSYLFNNVSGAVFGTLFAVLFLFASVYYVYIILPKKKFPNLAPGNPFMFARFDNTLHEAGSEENLKIGVEPEPPENPPQAFDNPMYTGSPEPKNDFNKVNLNTELHPSTKDDQNTSGESSTKEYSNPVYTELEKTERLDDFAAQSEEEKLEEDEFSEIKL